MRRRPRAARDLVRGLSPCPPTPPTWTGYADCPMSDRRYLEEVLGASVIGSSGHCAGDLDDRTSALLRVAALVALDGPSSCLRIGGRDRAGGRRVRRRDRRCDGRRGLDRRIGPPRVSGPQGRPGPRLRRRRGPRGTRSPASSGVLAPPRRGRRPFRPGRPRPASCRGGVALGVRRARRLRPSTSEYTTGTTMSVRKVELNSPPMTTVPSSAAMMLPWLKPAASGIRARMVAMAVIRMGRTRVRPPSTRASYVE